MKSLSINPTISDVVRAYSFLCNRVRHTPLEYSYELSDIANAPVYIKWENLQMCRSFKVRGAFYKMNHLGMEDRKRGVVTCSSGNHAQGVAIAARELEITAHVFVPKTCPETKKKAIRRYGGRWVVLHVCDGNYDEAEEAAHLFAEEKRITYVSSFEDPFIIAGQGTVGFEMFLDEVDIELVVVPTGGGGLLNGVAIAAKALNPSSEIYGVQSETSNPWVVSWEDGIVKKVEYGDTLADGLSGGIPQSLLSLAKLRVSGICEITEEDIVNAIAFLHREHHQIVEGAGAVGVAAVLSGKLDLQGRKTGIVVSGGNIDNTILERVL